MNEETKNFNDPFWNLGQLFAWVLLKDKALVHRASDNTHEHGTHVEELTTPDGETKRVDVPNKRPDASRVILAAIYRGQSESNPYEDTRRDIEHKLQSGELKAYGLENGRGDLTEIKPLQWADLKLTFSPDKAMPKELFRAGATQWENLKFDRLEVFKIWPETPARQTTGTDRNRCYEWLYNLMKNGNREKPKDDYIREAQSKFSSLSGKAFKELWAEAARNSGNESWTKAGRMKKRN